MADEKSFLEGGGLCCAFEKLVFVKYTDFFCSYFYGFMGFLGPLFLWVYGASQNTEIRKWFKYVCPATFHLFGIQRLKFVWLVLSKNGLIEFSIVQKSLDLYWKCLKFMGVGYENTVKRMSTRNVSLT